MGTPCSMAAASMALDVPHHFHLRAGHRCRSPAVRGWCWKWGLEWGWCWKGWDVPLCCSPSGAVIRSLASATGKEYSEVGWRLYWVKSSKVAHSACTSLGLELWADAGWTLLRAPGCRELLRCPSLIPKGCVRRCCASVWWDRCHQCWRGPRLPQSSLEACICGSYWSGGWFRPSSPSEDGGGDGRNK